MESDKRPRWPYGFDNDELNLIENLTMGMRPGCRCRSNNNNGCDNNCSENSNNSNNSSCNCENCENPRFDRNVALAMVYSPDHEFDCMYDPENGLMAGTLFIGLDKPFYGASVSGGNRK